MDISVLEETPEKAKGMEATLLLNKVITVTCLMLIVSSYAYLRALYTVMIL